MYSFYPPPTDQVAHLTKHETVKCFPYYRKACSDVGFKISLLCQHKHQIYFMKLKFVFKSEHRFVVGRTTV